jgi:hypothetical protein
LSDGNQNEVTLLQLVLLFIRRARAVVNMSSANRLRASAIAPATIAAGLGVLVAQCWWPAVPVATGIALVALGAIIATIQRARRRSSFRGTLTLSLFVYASLYLLLAGAILDAAIRGPSGSLALHQCFDLGLSAIVMLFVARIGITVFTAAGHTTTR